MRHHYVWKFRDVEKRLLIQAYEALHNCTIDGAVPQGWYDTHREEIGNRLGAVWMYRKDGGFGGEPLFIDELLSGLGIYLEVEEESGDV